MPRFAHAFGLTFLAGLTLMSGCSSVSPIQEVTADIPGYFGKKFAVPLLRESVVKKIPASLTPAVSMREMKVTMTADFENSDGKSEQAQITATYTPTDKGLIQRFQEYSANGIPYALFYSLTYQGLQDLRWQNAPLRSSVTSPLYEIKEIERMDAMPTQVGQTFNIRYQTGTEGQVANFRSFEKRCKVARSRPATTIDASLRGEALDVECEYLVNTLVDMRSNYVFLKDYGVSMLTENISSNRKAKYTITKVQVST
jgi:hypothetical protein